MSTISDNAARLNVPDELRELLLDFTIGYLLEQPNNLIEYGIEFFEKLKNTKSSSNIKQQSAGDFSDEDDASDIDEAPPTRYNSRRKSVFAETYNPEEDEEEEGPNVVFPKSDDQRQALAASVKNIFIFRALDPEQMNNVIDAMFDREVHAGDDIIKQGDDGDNFYVIDRGTFEAYVTDADGNDRLVHTYEHKGSFGELALLYNMPRAATIKAKSDGLLWAMDRQIFRRIVLKSAFKKRKMYEELIEVVPMLKTLQSYERMNLADALVPKYYQDKDCIINQGDPGDGMYFVEEGIVNVLVTSETGEQIKVNQIEKGGYFGELALVTHKGRAASVFAEGKVKLAFLDVDAFERLLGPCMNIMQRNIEDYENQLVKIFGSKQNMTDVR
ncbi:cAMP-dependent protein kinase type II regulatory subunit [Acyrthosiphon pisum]|uniref:cAMP-dependent protein kinase type II regulatory subunit n=1 Tax=Acyrthosiphon pisum TaxID=7029 RepID=A0A8R2AAT6_ACYPI|nr:cAMP-dependent protein kinase type II regulatory subunit [Acyrthosiphon pisum]XP_016659706.1 cAMP-dependent protein kinase type II regulatory subunit [Acyrthosiphon pisum]|eukprot:XP_001944873.1 PREDICTED: cAMP-dependent protein kinase type II regulatory subunit [Acyrthosiphon pisum]